MAEIKVCYHGKFGVVTDMGKDIEVLGFPTETANMTPLVIPRYGVWKNTGRKHDIVLTTSDLKEATTCADTDHDGAFEEERRQRLWDHGGEECIQCGKQDYESNMVEHNGLFCEECAKELGYSPADFCDVVKALRMTRPSASLQATGGGIDCIRVVCGQKHGAGGYALYFGTANQKWGADVYTILANGEEEKDHSNVETDCRSEDSDAVKVAAAIHHAVGQFEAKHAEGAQ